MDLIKDQPLNFRYVFLTSVDKRVYVLFYYEPNFISSNSEETRLETTDIPYLNKIWIDSETQRYTVHDDMIQIDIFNDRLYKYIKARVSSGIKQISVINTITTYNKIIFEPRIFEIMAKCSKDLYFDLWDSAIRTTDVKYEPLDKLTFNSGNLLLEKTTVLRIKNFDVIKLTVDVYNKVENDCYINFMIEKQVLAINISFYSTIKSVFTCTTTDSGDYIANAKLNICYMRIFGMEIIDKDHKNERMLIQGFNKAMVGCIEVEENVRYGTIIKLNSMNNISINEIIRTIKDIKPGSFIIIGGLAILSLHQCNVIVDKLATISDGTSLISFLPDDKKLNRSINIYESEIINKSNKNLNICKLIDVEINSVYISNCIINTRVKPIVKDTDAVLKKLTYNFCDFNLESDFTIKESIQLNLTDSNFNMEGYNLNINSAKITVGGGKWNYDKCTITNDEPIIKTVLEKTEMTGNDLIIKNSDKAIMSTTLFGTKLKLNIDNINIKGFAPNMNTTFFKTKKLEFGTERATLLIDCIISPKEKNTTKIISNNSILASLDIINTIKDSIIDFILNDKDKFYTRNKISINDAGEVLPRIDYNINAPTTITYTNFKPDYINLKVSDKYEPEQDSFILIKDTYHDTRPINTRIINNSEKNCSVSDHFYDNNNHYSFVIKKI